MPIVIMPNGEMVDSVTGNPVDTPRPMPDNMGEFIANRPMRERTGATLTPQELQSDMARRTGSAMTDLEKVQMLMDMGLDQDTAIEAVAMEKNMPPVDPRQFSDAQQAQMQGGTPMPTPTQPPMGALSGVPMGASVPMPMRRPEDLMMRNNSMGQDRTMNPMDRLTPRNAPST